MRKILIAALTTALSLGVGQAYAACGLLKPLGNIKMQMQDDRWVIPVGINGTPKYMTLATGFGVSTFTPEVVAELHLPVRNTRLAVLVSPDGQRSYGHVSVDTLTLGTAGQFSNSLYVIDTPLPNGTKRPVSAPAGYIAMDLLNHFDFDMDLKNGTLNLFDVDHCDGQVVYWKNDGVVSVPFEWDPKGRIRFKATLDGNLLYAVLNTMDPDNTLNLDYYKAVSGFDETAPGVERLPDMSDGAKLYHASFKTLDFGGVVIQNPILRVQEDLLKRQTKGITVIGSTIRNSDIMRDPDLTLGVAMLSKLHVYVASKERKLYISLASAPAQ